MKYPLYFALLLASACSTTTHKESIAATQKAEVRLEDLVKSARALPALEGENFAAFKERAHSEVNAPQNQAADHALLAVFARRQAMSEAPAFLAKMISHKTVNAADVEVPGRGAAFDAMEADLLAFAQTNNLVFSTVEHVAHDIALSEDKKGQERVAVLVHGDVVPAAEPGWTSDAFKGEVTADRVLGRGALDDKGAMVAVLYALKSIQEAKVALKKNPTLIIGSSEETHWTGIERYLEVRGTPKSVFVADGGFPVGIGEKGVSTLKIEVKREDALPPFASAIDAQPVHLVNFSGGQVANQVPAEASVILHFPLKEDPRLAAMAKDAEAHDFTYEILENSDLKITSKGTAAHGSTPQEGKNAISPLVRFLVVHGALEDDGCTRLFDVLDRVLDAGFAGARLGMTHTHSRFSVATANLGVVKADENRCLAKINLRWPPAENGADTSAKNVVAEATKILKSEAEDRLLIDVKGGGLDPFLVPEDSDFVRALQESFVLFNGPSQETTVTLSGTTYAKAVPGAVTFGPSRKGVSGSRIHGANEYITLDELGELVELYTHALLSLSR